MIAAMIPKITIIVNFILGFMEHINTIITPFHNKIICFIKNHDDCLIDRSHKYDILHYYPLLM